MASRHTARLGLDLTEASKRSAATESALEPHFFGSVLTYSRQRPTHASSSRFDAKPFGST